MVPAQDTFYCTMIPLTTFSCLFTPYFWLGPQSRQGRNTLSFAGVGLYRILQNKYSSLNKCAPDFWLYLPISQNFIPISFKISAINVEVFSSPHNKFHYNQTRLKVCFLPPHLVRLFGEIQYSPPAKIPSSITVYTTGTGSPPQQPDQNVRFLAQQAVWWQKSMGRWMHGQSGYKTLWSCDT